MPKSLPEAGLNLVDIALADHISDVGWKKHFVVCRFEVTQGILPKQLCNFVCRFHSCLYGDRYRSHFELQKTETEIPRVVESTLGR